MRVTGVTHHVADDPDYGYFEVGDLVYVAYSPAKPEDPNHAFTIKITGQTGLVLRVEMTRLLVRFPAVGTYYVLRRYTERISGAKESGVKGTGT